MESNNFNRIFLQNILIPTNLQHQFRNCSNPMNLLESKLSNSVHTHCRQSGSYCCLPYCPAESRLCEIQYFKEHSRSGRYSYPAVNFEVLSNFTVPRGTSSRGLYGGVYTVGSSFTYRRYKLFNFKISAEENISTELYIFKYMVYLV